MFILIGAILIIFSTIFTNFIGEILLIAGWVVIWEVFYDLFFNRIKRKVKQKKRIIKAIKYKFALFYLICTFAYR